MHKIITIFICLLSFVFVNAQTKSRNLEKLIQQQKAAKELLDSYKFSEAATQLEEDIEFAEKKHLATDTLESYLDFANMGQNMLTSTEKVVFIDSVVIDKNRFLEVYKMSEESGDIDLFKNVFKSQSASSEVENSFTYNIHIKNCDNENNLSLQMEVDKNIEKVKVGQKIRVKVEKNSVFDF